MAQGLDVRALSSAKSPTMDTKTSGESVKRARGMGSRRIFSPQFKIQVLDSYRNDADCRGNQRATARKYNIHRRQIQKWLQCEQSLRNTIEETGRMEVTDLTGGKLRKKADTSEDEESDLTLNQSATAMTRLGDADSKTFGVTPRQESRICSRTDAQNLKRVAQRLYPSLQNIPCVPEEKVADSGAQKYFRGDVACAFGLSPGEGETRDTNYNRLNVRTDDEEPLDLKSKVREETLPEEEFLVETSEEDAVTAAAAATDKLRIRVWDNCQSGLTSSGENVGGPKLSASNAALKCPTQKYNMGDVDQRSGDSEKDELLCSRTVNGAESCCLPNVPVPVNSASVSSPPSPDSDFSLKRKFNPEEDTDTVDGDSCSSSRDQSPEKCVKKTRNQSTGVVNGAKSFNPKRKWIEESMQEMMEEGGDQSQESPSSLPIKQRVKMNLKSMPEVREPKREEARRPSGVSSNFTIEKLCSPDPCKDPEGSDCYARPPPSETPFSYPPPLIISNRFVSDVGSFNLKPEMYNHDSHLGIDACSPCDYSLNLPLKEERISDEEDADVDVLSTTPVEKKSFDFSGYNFGKRRSFSVQFKLTVLDAFYNDKDCNKNQRATARKFNINRRQVQKWLSQESDLRSESSLKSGKYLQRQRLATESPKEGDGCARCPQHCLRKKEELYTFGDTIEVNVKPCSDKECLSGAGRARGTQEDRFGPDYSRTGLTAGLDLYSRTLFPSDLKTGNFYQGYLYHPENNNMLYHESILGWSQALNSSALTVPNFQCLSAWHRRFDYCPENAKIY